MIKWGTQKKTAPECKPLTFQEAQDIVGRITYKMSTKLELHWEPLASGWSLVAQHYVPDAEEPARTTLVSTVAFINAQLVSQGALLAFVAHTIRRLEMHEVDEWLKFDGVHLKHPHPTGHT